MVLAALLFLLQAAPEKETLQVPGSKLTFDLVKIPGGPGLAPFWIGAREVTWEEFNAFYGSRKEARLDGVTRPSDGIDILSHAMGVPASTFEASRPVAFVRWHGAVTYCEWLSRKTGRSFRLPTEKEWEAAARAGQTADAPAAPDGESWHQGNSEKRNHPVGEKKPNAFGLYDILGNVWEYCAEFDTATFGPILRGGSYASPAAAYAARRTVPPDWFEIDPNRPRSRWWLFGSTAEAGFRVVCVPEAATPEERGRVAPKIRVRILGRAEETVGGRGAEDFFVRLKAEVANGTERAIDELDLRFFFIDPETGKPALIDTSAHVQPIFTSCWPVLSNSRHPAAAAPLEPGELRTFEVFVPQSFAEFDTGSWKADATVMSVRFKKE
jgi:hypothetical protein